MSERFTIVFEGDIRKFSGNPLKTETPFGVPYTVAVGDIIEQFNDLQDARVHAPAPCDVIVGRGETPDEFEERIHAAIRIFLPDPAVKAMTYEKWKDGIDIAHVTNAALAFAKHIEASGPRSTARNDEPVTANYGKQHLSGPAVEAIESAQDTEELAAPPSPATVREALIKAKTCLLDGCLPWVRHNGPREGTTHGRIDETVAAIDAALSSAQVAPAAPVAGAPQPSPETDAVKEIVELYFAPWGAAKGARWEALSGDQPFNAEVAINLIEAALHRNNEQAGGARA